MQNVTGLKSRLCQHWRISYWVAIFLTCSAAFSGCTSVESTMVTRNETNEMWERHNCLNGIPITLKVPTHLKVYVYHKHYLEIVKNADSKTIDVKPLDLDVVVRDFAHELMYTDKVFVVDFKRPAAGSSNLKVKMTDQQYIDEIQHDITDDTIKQVAGLLGGLVGSGGLRINPAAASGESLPDTSEVRSLVAAGIFEIESPDFEVQVRQFINCHVNKAHDAWVVPPDVSSISRVGIPPADNLQTPYPLSPLCTPGDCEHCLPHPVMPMPMQEEIPVPLPYGPRPLSEPVRYVPTPLP